MLCVRWYLRFKLSRRDLVEMMAERGLSLAHTTIMRWVQHYTPEFEKRWHRYALAVGRSWRVDESVLQQAAHSHPSATVATELKTLFREGNSSRCHSDMAGDRSDRLTTAYLRNAQNRFTSAGYAG
jgi:hypothetical protein